MELQVVKEVETVCRKFELLRRGIDQQAVGFPEAGGLDKGFVQALAFGREGDFAEVGGACGALEFQPRGLKADAGHPQGVASGGDAREAEASPPVRGGASHEEGIAAEEGDVGKFYGLAAFGATHAARQDALRLQRHGKAQEE